MPLSGTVCHPSAGTSYDQAAYQYEVSMATNYEDMNGDEKCKKLGWFGCYWSPKVIENIAI